MREEGISSLCELPKFAQESCDQMNDKEFNVRFEEFKTELTKLADAELKLKLALSFMEEALAQEKKPDFRNFWEVRKICLELFKEQISSQNRSELWSRYRKLSDEAKKLKDHLDEESKFASEQIEIAIQAIEKEIENIKEGLKEAKQELFSVRCESLDKNLPVYEQCQGELNLLNAYATRINQMRKELIKTEMRISIKNKFFQRLSKMGDQVFPRRKELINQVSDQFVADVNAFIEKDFNQHYRNESPFFFRNEIKGLQMAAKVLTLNTQVFNQTRLKLSECWDKLKLHEKDRKKEFTQRKELRKSNSSEIKENIEVLLQNFLNGSLSATETQRNAESIVAKMRSVDLGKEELSELRQKLADLHAKISAKVDVEVQEKKQAEIQRIEKKEGALRELKKKIELFLESADELDIDQLIEKRNALVAEIHSAAITKLDKMELEKGLKGLKDILADKKEKMLMALPEDRRQALEQLKELLSQRKEKREDIKQHLEVLRKKSKALSGLDFERAMQLDQEIKQEKSRYDASNLAVKEIEEKIKEIQ